MHLTCRQSALRAGLAIVNHAIAKRSTLPVLSNILLTAKDGTLTLEATNLEIGMRCTVEASIAAEGALTIPAKLLTDLVNSLSEGDVTLTTDKTMLTLKAAHHTANLCGMAAEEFPLIPHASTDAPSVTLPAATFKSMITEVAFAASVDDARPVFTGVLVEVSEQELSLAAADSFRLAVSTMPLPAIGHPCGTFLVPASTLLELAKVLPATGYVTIQVTPQQNQVLFQTDTVTLVSRLIDGQFPNFRQLIPTTVDTRVLVHKADFQQATKSVALFARESSNILRLGVARDAIPPEEEDDPNISGQEPMPVPGTLTLQATAEDTGDSTSTLPITLEDGPDISIIVNVRYLSDVLAVLEAEEVELHFTTSTQPMVLHPHGRESYTYLIMPMHNVR